MVAAAPRWTCDCIIRPTTPGTRGEGDDRVAKPHHKRLVADEFPRLAHGIGIAGGPPLPHVVEFNALGRVVNLADRTIAQARCKLWIVVEVILNRALLASRYKEKLV